MPKYKVTYFNIRALGEPVRYLLSYMGEDFEDERLLRQDWYPLKSKYNFGKLPVLEIDGKAYNDSAAICRYLGNEAGLGGKTPLENLIIDQIAGAMGDLHGEVFKLAIAQDAAAKEKVKQKLETEIIPFYYSRLEKILEENGGYLANGKLSWVDLYWVAYSEILPIPLDKLPNFKSLTERVQALPGIKEWVARRPDSRIAEEKHINMTN